MSLIVGIDLGTTNSLVAATIQGVPTVLGGIVPSVVHYPKDGGPPVVGNDARRIESCHSITTGHSD